ncbi:MAG: SulP family inorganic anion transporter [Bacteroidia bacterium]
METTEVVTKKIKTMKTKNETPLDGLAGLKQNFWADLQAGLMVFLLALPLSLGIAKASSIPNPIFGVVTAIVGGIVVAFFAGSRLTIKGPAAGLIVIISGAIAAFGGGEHGWHLAMGCAVVAALLQIAFGLLKMGKFSDFFPGAAIHGMLAAIGIIIIIKNLPVLFGVNPSFLKNPETHKGYEMTELLANFPSILSHYDKNILLIGLVCIVIVFGFSFIKTGFLKKIPAPLVVLVFAIPLGIYYSLSTDEIVHEYSLVKVGHITDILSKQFINVDFSGISSNTGVFIQYVILFALIGSLESLLTVKAIDDLDPYKRKSDANKDLTAVGIGNTLAGIMGASPMISEVVRSSANVGYGAKTRWSNFFHGMFLLVALLLAVPIIEMIPNTALAALLIFAGYRLASPQEFKHMWHIGKDQFFIFVATVIITVTTDLLIGVGCGILLEIIINLIHGASLSNLFKSRTEITTSGEQIQVKVSGDALFSNFLGLKKKLYGLEQGKQVLLDLAGCKVIDHTTLHTLKDFKRQYENEGGHIKITGFELHHVTGHHEASTRVKK